MSVLVYEMPDTNNVNRGAAISILMSAFLCGIGIVRMLSYSRGSGITLWLLDSPLSPLAYQPDVVWSVRFFKVISTPVVASGLYFLFRLLNRGAVSSLPGATIDPSRRIDFVSPWTRLALTTVVSLHWIPIEYMKFQSTDFYPSSRLENPWVNIGVLAVSQLLAFVGMRYLSFEPLVSDNRGDADSLPR